MEEPLESLNIREAGLALRQAQSCWKNSCSFVHTETRGLALKQKAFDVRISSRAPRRKG